MSRRIQKQALQVAELYRKPAELSTSPHPDAVREGYAGRLSCYDGAETARRPR